MLPVGGVPEAARLVREGLLALAIRVAGPVRRGRHLDDREMLGSAVGQVLLPFLGTRAHGSRPGGVPEPEERGAVGQGEVAPVIANPGEAMPVKGVLALVGGHGNGPATTVQAGVGEIRTLGFPAPLSRSRKGATETEGLASVPEAKAAQHPFSRSPVGDAQNHFGVGVRRRAAAGQFLLPPLPDDRARGGVGGRLRASAPRREEGESHNNQRGDRSFHRFELRGISGWLRRRSASPKRRRSSSAAVSLASVESVGRS